MRSDPNRELRREIKQRQAAATANGVGVVEAASILGISPSTLRKRIRTGEVVVQTIRGKDADHQGGVAPTIRVVISAPESHDSWAQDLRSKFGDARRLVRLHGILIPAAYPGAGNSRPYVPGQDLG